MPANLGAFFVRTDFLPASDPGTANASSFETDRNVHGQFCECFCSCMSVQSKTPYLSHESSICLTGIRIDVAEPVCRVARNVSTSGHSCPTAPTHPTCVFPHFSPFATSACGLLSPDHGSALPNGEKTAIFDSNAVDPRYQEITAISWDLSPLLTKGRKIRAGLR